MRHSLDVIGSTGQTVCFFPGCALRQLAPELSDRAVGWLESEGFAVRRFDGCCALPLAHRGETDRYEKAVSSVLSYLWRTGVRTIVAVCPNCFYSLRNACAKDSTPRIEVVSYADLMVQAGYTINADIAGEEALFTIHDSCPDRFEQVFADALRWIARDLRLAEMSHHGCNSICCGVGEQFATVSFDEQVAQAEYRLREAQAIEADAVIAACANCTYALTEADSGCEIYHYLELVFDEYIDWHTRGAQSRQ